MNWQELVRSSDEQLTLLDPVVLNLEVAKGIPALAHLHVIKYRRRVDRWADDFHERLSGWEVEFHKWPENWDGDINLFRLGQLCFYTDQILGIRYHEEQRDILKASYTDPSDLFLNGVMDNRRGTCGNMAALHLAIGWRLGWPVSLALAWWHLILRFDNGKVVWNIESSNTEGGFRASPDEFYMDQFGIAPEHVRSGSDLAFLKPRQLLGTFIGLRGRHWWDVIDAAKARDDYRLASRLYPQSRLWRQKAVEAALTAGFWFREADALAPAPREFCTSATAGLGYRG